MTKKQNQTAPFFAEDETPDHAASIDRILTYFSPVEQAVQTLPLLKLFPRGKAAFSLCLFCFDHVEAGKFFYDMVTRYLLPTKTLELWRVFLAPFRLSCCDRPLLLGEIVFRIGSELDRPELERRFYALKEDILFGVQSPYYASRMLELKALALDDKHALVQDRLARIMRRFPRWYGLDLFSWMQRFFLAVHSDYLRMHEVRQVAQTVTFFYLIEKQLLADMDQVSRRRHVRMKVALRRYHFPLGVSQVVGIAVGVTFLRDHEVFARHHLVKAIKAIAPQLEILDHTFFLYRAADQPLEVLYVEFVPKKGCDSHALRQLMKQIHLELPRRVKERIEQLHHPLFMPSNEEEVMRHIVTLSKEVRFLRSLPQVVISFDQQTGQALLFTVVIARVLMRNSLSAHEVVARLGILQPKVERMKKVGYLRKKYPKEAVVIKVSLPVDDFLRDNQSIDLYRARRVVLRNLETALGCVRDYNGGMIAKQNEVLCALAECVHKQGKEHQLLLENFFHSLYPIEQRACLRPEALAAWFLLLVKAISKSFSDQRSELYLREEGKILAIVVECQDAGTREKIMALTGQLKEVIPELISFQLNWDERYFAGYLLTTAESDKRAYFTTALRQILAMH
ncbi:MAG: hypothetical protein AAF443_00700 [Chlamydiota bacterium]